jgi:phage host-nuclease inhibitor protein Gam
MVQNKSNAAVDVPQDRAEAVAALAEYGAVQRELERLETLMNEEIAAVKQTASVKAEPFRARAEALETSLQVFCEANRKALMKESGGAKTVDMGVGKVIWRWQPAKVVLKAKEKDTIEAIQAGGEAMAGFLRATFEINKVGMLRNPALARTLDGVEIVEGVETFEVKWDSVKIPEAKTEEAAA